jgi:elongation factor Ts
MAEITAASVKELRERTGAGMMDCKKALGETAGEMEAAIDWLRTKGLAAAAKKAGRTAAEGLVGVEVDGNKGAIVEINSETDFVAKNEQFQDFVRTAAAITLGTGSDIDALKEACWPGGGTVEEKLTSNIATIGENQAIRRAALLEVEEGAIVSYVHNAAAPGLGKIGVLVAVEAPDGEEAVLTLGRQVGMHVAAARPEALDIDAVDASALEREKAVLTEQARESGKPEAIIERMVEGRIRKYYEEVVLLEQVWVHDGESRVRAVAKKAGVTLTGFARFELGEGIDRQSGDFAAEVAAAAGVKPGAETTDESGATL